MTYRKTFLLLFATLFLISCTKNSTKPADSAASPNLGIEEVKVGVGKEAQKGNRVTVHYTGWLKSDGTKFATSVDRGPFTFTLGNGEVIKGWDQGVAGMKVGGKRKLTIPSDLAYGSQGAGGVIPPEADLIFEVDLIDVQ